MKIKVNYETKVLEVEQGTKVINLLKEETACPESVERRGAEAEDE